MKIRTDFVTNSSSSSFVVEIEFTMRDGRCFSYSEIGIDYEGDPIVGELYLYASPRQLGMSKSVADMIQLLKSSVKDFDWSCEGEEPKRLFDETHPETKKILNGEFIKAAENEYERSFCERQKTAHEAAQEFIRKLGSIKDMNEIEKITISGEEHNYKDYDRKYTYNLVTGEYTCKIYGEEFEKDGGSGGDLCFKDAFLAKEERDLNYYAIDEEDRGFDGYRRLTEKDLPIVIPIEGTKYAGRIERIEHVKVGDKLILKADLDNKFYDPVAIEVFNSENKTLGYLCDTFENPLSSIAGILDEVVAYVDSVTPLSARGKNAKYALMHIKLASKRETEDRKIMSDYKDFKIENGVLKEYNGSGGDVIIPEGVTRIDSDCFYDCSSLTSVTIPDSVTSIGQEAFLGCSGLTSVMIPDSVTYIDFGSFADCSNLMSVMIPESVTSIMDDAFDGCNSLTIHAPAGSYAEQYAKGRHISFEVL